VVGDRSTRIPSEGRDVDAVSVPAVAHASGRLVVATIGIDRYRHWRRLSNAVGDAMGAAELFRRLGFVEVVPPLLDDRATGDAIEALVTDELTGLDASDSLVVFYAGHGGSRTQRVGGREVLTGYLIPVDAASDHHRVTSWIELDPWLRRISKLPPRHILVVLDACFSGIALSQAVKWGRDSGALLDLPFAAANARPSRLVITSALDNEKAMDEGPMPGHSLFTGCLIEALTGGLSPVGTHDGRHVTIGSEIGRYVRNRVQTYPGRPGWQQTPDLGTFDFDERGEMLIPVLVGDALAAAPAVLAAGSAGWNRARPATEPAGPAPAAVQTATIEAAAVEATATEAAAIEATAIEAAAIEATAAKAAIPEAAAVDAGAKAAASKAAFEAAIAARVDRELAALRAEDSAASGAAPRTTQSYRRWRLKIVIVISVISTLTIAAVIAREAIKGSAIPSADSAIPSATPLRGSAMSVDSTAAESKPSKETLSPAATSGDAAVVEPMQSIGAPVGSATAAGADAPKRPAVSMDSARNVRSVTPAGAANTGSGARTVARGNAAAPSAGTAICRTLIKSPKGAEVSWNGIVATVPAELPLPCDTEVTLAFGGPQYLPETKRVTATAGGKPIIVRLVRSTIDVEINSTPPGAAIIVGKDQVGTTPATIVLPASTTSMVTLARSGYKTVTKKVTPSENANQVNVTLTPAPGGP